MNAELIHLFLLIIVANGSPIIQRHMFRNRDGLAVDMGWIFVDGQPCLGRNKTWRGIGFAMVFSALVAWILGYGLLPGLWVACLAMLGDMVASFIKRRLQITPSGRALLLDQLPESLFPALGLREYFNLDWVDVGVIVLLFTVSDLLLSRFLYYFGLRKKPY